VLQKKWIVTFEGRVQEALKNLDRPFWGGLYRIIFDAIVRPNASI
jgi:hypothetical protein